MSGHEAEAQSTWQRRQFLVRASVFIALAAVAQASAALPPGPNNLTFYWASLAVFVAAALCVFLPLQRLPEWAILVPILGYLVSVCLLLISGGTNPNVQSTAGGLSALVLLAVLAVALYYPGTYAVVVIAASSVALAVAGIVAQLSAANNIRRIFLWAAVSAVVAITIHRLRHSLESEVRDSAELARLGRLMNGATQSLTSLRDPKDVIDEGTKVMSELAGPAVFRAAYLRVRDGVITQEAVADDRGSMPSSSLLKDDPYVSAVMETKKPLVTELDRAVMGPTMRSIVDEVGSTHAAFIPVAPSGQLHGIVALETRGTPLSGEVVARCRALANVLELALGNALAHQELEIQANSDPLTGVANRRGLALFLEGDRRLDAMGILVMDIDGLKAINDAHGHDVGDKILVGVARAASGVLRGGDLLARIGGDEFVAVVAGADDADARRVVERIEDAVSRINAQGVRASVSIGYACCGKNGDVERTRQLADEAMYTTKREERRRHARHPQPPVDRDLTTPGG
jgi:diguanylate cyclase (GGDEF)-like protein